MSRDRLLTRAIEEAEQKWQATTMFYPFQKLGLASHSLMAKMDAFMQDGVDKGMFSAHNKVVAMAIASIMVADKAEPAETSEQALYDRERRAFCILPKPMLQRR